MINFDFFSQKWAIKKIRYNIPETEIKRLLITNYIKYQKFRRKTFRRKNFGGKNFGQLFPISAEKNSAGKNSAE